MGWPVLVAGFWAFLSAREASAGNTSSGWNLRRHYSDAADWAYIQDNAIYKFRILSWNILAESWTLFGESNKEMHQDLRWRARRPRILRELQARNPHIIVMQELEDLVYHWEILPELTVMGYHGVFASSQQSKVGVAVLWKTNHFFMSMSSEINLGEPYHSRWYVPMFDRLSKEQQERYLVLSANRAALFVVLVPRFVKQRPQRHALLLCAAHIASIVHDVPIGIDLQTFQAVLLMEAIEDMVKQQAAKQISVNLIVAADLNTQASYSAASVDALALKATGKPLGLSGYGAAPSPVYDIFTRGFLSEEALGLVILAMKAGGWTPSSMMFREFQEMLVEDWRDYALQSVHKEVLRREPYTCMGKDYEQADYILFSSVRSAVARLALLGVLAPPEQFSHRQLIRSLGSDHVPVVADFAFMET